MNSYNHQEEHWFLQNESPNGISPRDTSCHEHFVTGFQEKESIPWFPLLNDEALAFDTGVSGIYPSDLLHADNPSLVHPSFRLYEYSDTPESIHWASEPPPQRPYQDRPPTLDTSSPHTIAPEDLHYSNDEAHGSLSSYQIPSCLESGSSLHYNDESTHVISTSSVGAEFGSDGAYESSSPELWLPPKSSEAFSSCTGSYSSPSAEALEQSASQIQPFMQPSFLYASFPVSYSTPRFQQAGSYHGHSQQSPSPSPRSVPAPTFSRAPQALSTVSSTVSSSTRTSKKQSRRTNNILNTRPQNWYAPLTQIPEYGNGISYTLAGEIQPGYYFTAPEMVTFLYSHPLHSWNSASNRRHDKSFLQDRKNSPLRLWIQKVPSDSARRYPTPLSSFCRFKDCFGGHKLRVGQFRIAIDELTAFDGRSQHSAHPWISPQSAREDAHDRDSDAENVHDPYINAGYIHLFCAERLLDFPQLCAHLNIRADNRILPREPDGRNRMALEAGCIDVANSFIQKCEQRLPTGSIFEGGLLEGYPYPFPRSISARHPTQETMHSTPHLNTSRYEETENDMNEYNAPHHGTLTQLLCQRKRDDEPPIRARIRAERNGGTEPPDYQGDLRMEDKFDEKLHRQRMLESVKQSGSLSKSSTTRKTGAKLRSLTTTAARSHELEHIDYHIPRTRLQSQNALKVVGTAVLPGQKGEESDLYSYGSPSYIYPSLYNRQNRSQDGKDSLLRQEPVTAYGCNDAEDYCYASMTGEEAVCPVTLDTGENMRLQQQQGKRSRRSVSSSSTTSSRSSSASSFVVVDPLSPSYKDRRLDSNGNRSGNSKNDGEPCLRGPASDKAGVAAEMNASSPKDAKRVSRGKRRKMGNP